MTREIDKQQRDHDEIASSDNSGDEDDPAPVEGRANNPINGTADGSRTVPVDSGLPASSATTHFSSASRSTHLETPTNPILNEGAANTSGIRPVDSDVAAPSTTTVPPSRSAHLGEDNHPNPNPNNHPNHNLMPPNQMPNDANHNLMPPNQMPNDANHNLMPPNQMPNDANHNLMPPNQMPNDANHNLMPPNPMPNANAVNVRPPIQESVGDEHDDRDLVDLLTPKPIL